MAFRTERDQLGELNVPADAYYGIQTARAVENFPISGLRAPADLVTATILVKKAAAEANRSLGRLDADRAGAIIGAADEILAGRLRDQFVVDVYQAGAGTSHNMNANEVLANRAAELLGEPRGTYSRVHPNDHVNMGQSTNDVYPTAVRLALLSGAGPLAAAAHELAGSLARKSEEFADVLKTGRTHLQDAVPMTLGQEFGGWAACIQRAAEGVAEASEQLLELNIGATAVGTGLNAGDEFRRLVVDHLARETTLPVKPALNLFRVTQSMGDVLGYSGAMRRLAVELGKVVSDLRLLSMGPRAGLGEIALPAVQPGSSIMPGKINPSVPEMVNQVCFQAIGCDTTIALACEAGQLELNVMMPVIAWNALHASTILREAMKALRTRTIDGITADESRARELLDRSTAAATALSPHIGYAATADVASEAVRTGKTIRAVVLERGLLPEEQLDEILSLEAMTQGGVTGRKGKTRRSARGFTTWMCALAVVGNLLPAASAFPALAALSAQARRPARPGPPGPPGPPSRPAPAAAAQPQGRLFLPQDLGLLEGADRDQWQKPDQIMDGLNIADGSVVADLGAGGGWFTARLSRRVGPNGLVYAEDIQPLMIEAIGRRVERENLKNVRPVLGTATDPRLPAGRLDAVLIIDAYHEMEIPPGDPVALLKAVAQSLKPTGRVGIVDFNPGGGGPGPAPGERVDPQAILRAAAAAGLQLVTRHPQVNAFQFLLVFAKSASP